MSTTTTMQAQESRAHTMTVKISLIIPSYNRGALIAETIDSALAQTEPFHEIIVVDDGSTDDTDTVLARYGAAIRVIKRARGGVQAARNAGAALATGNFLALCDSDDLLEPGFLQCAADWFRAHPDYDAFYSNFVTFNDTGIQRDKFAGAPQGYFDGAKREGDYLHDIPGLYGRTVQYQPLFISGAIVSRVLFDRIGGFDVRFNDIGGEDWEFTLRAIGAGKVAMTALPLVKIRKHDSNQSKDSVRSERGTAHILEHALEHHPGAADFRDQIRTSIEARRLRAFNGAFETAKFAVAEEMLSKLRRPPTDLRFRLKVLILGMPAPLRHWLWRLTQAR
ncbi:glycosyltransferase family 2 protein [Massilia sp. YIM B02443]|uniref:glycosyltransferase family 2 protein n=1 Tax=Massilia sp. YIM B02443 TaxID=3050127 RepID=UPI0025B65F04|nr:glycosyltransferase family 2 protein [Massilia sp. YIM B02443]MDN4038038.1 glycosyltransferase [Massilia sp. YIM B02443]